MLLRLISVLSTSKWQSVVCSWQAPCGRWLAASGCKVGLEPRHAALCLAAGGGKEWVCPSEPLYVVLGLAGGLAALAARVLTCAVAQ